MGGGQGTARHRVDSFTTVASDAGAGLVAGGMCNSPPTPRRIARDGRICCRARRFSRRFDALTPRDSRGKCPRRSKQPFTGPCCKSCSHGIPATAGLGRQTEWVGNPVRPAIVAIESPEQRAVGQRDLLRLLVIGGSQGAEVLNRLVPAAIVELPVSERPDIVHQCGKAGPQDTIERYRGLGIEADVVEYIDDIAAAYRNADLVICRSGAMTVAEISVAGVAALLVPFPHAVGDHQSMNAAFLAERGAARVIPQKQLSSGSLAGVLMELFDDRSKLLALAHAARSLACPDATERVAGFCLEAMGA